LLEYLVAEHGFTVFAIEANWPESLAVDEYVMTGVGDPAAALAGMRFWTWDTEEVLEMIRWMRAWNEDPSHQQKVRFFGFDMQSPQVAAEAIVSYYEQIDPRFAECARRLLEAFGRGFTHTEHFKRSAADLDAIGKGLDSIAIRLATTRDLPDASTWNRVRHHLRIITQCHDLARSGDQDRAHIRDRSMAENLVWLMDTEAPGAKVVAWAHNGHVRKSEPSEPARTMGGFLADIFGARVVTVGLLFGEGSFQAIERAGERPSRGLREFTVPLPPPDSWDATLAAIGLPILALDLRRIPQGGSVAEWLSLPHSSRSIGSVFSDETASRMLTPLDAPRAFDIVLFIAKTTAARPNVKKPPRKPLPVAAPHPVNLDLRAGLVGEAPPGWQLSEKTRGVGHRVIVEGSGTGRRSLLIQSTTNDPANFANVLQRIDATPYRGMRIRFRADVRTEGDGHAQLWVRVDRENGDRGFFDNMGLTPIKTDVWREHAIEGEVDADAAVLNFGLVVVGEARAWFSHIALLCGPEITRTRVPADNGR
jgi:erythromycin esterase